MPPKGSRRVASASDLQQLALGREKRLKTLSDNSSKKFVLPKFVPFLDDGLDDQRIAVALRCCSKMLALQEKPTEFSNLLQKVHLGGHSYY